MRLSRLRVLLFTLLLASIALWIANQQSQSLITEPTEVTKPLAYSWQAKETTVWKFAPQEPAKQTIIKAQNIHYQDQLQKSEFTLPSVQIIDNDTLTQLSSKTGQSLNDKTVTFSGDVEIKQNAIQSTKMQSPTILKTSSLSYDTKSNQAYSDEKVFITQYNGKTTGTGLRANLETSEFQILSDVKGTYYPKKMQTDNAKPKQSIQPKGQ